jgi:flagellar biosynthesis protein FlhB
MADTAGRTERPTPKRREEARKEGQVVLSPEVSPVAVLFAALALASWGAPMALGRSRLVLGSWLAAVGPAAAGDAAVAPLAARALLEMAHVLVPFFLVTAVVGAGAVIAQVGWSPNASLLAPDLSRLSPARGARRIFSAAGAMNLAKAVVKIVVVLALATWILRQLGAEAVATPAMTPAALLAFTGTAIRRLLGAMALVLAVLGGLDWLWQRWRHEQQLKMTRHELREEQKETDGDPRVRARFRRAHRELARRHMLAETKRADVVLTNPVHGAVALRYRAAETAAPRVVAKGAGELAQRIKDAAQSAGVPIVERRALARALFRSVKLGAVIPPALYRAVSEILAYVYSLRGVGAEEVG